MEALVDPVVCNAVLGEIIRPDFLGAFSCAHLAPSFLAEAFLLFSLCFVKQARSEYVQRLLFVA